MGFSEIRSLTIFPSEHSMQFWEVLKSVSEL